MVTLRSDWVVINASLPLYLYPDTDQPQTLGASARQPNLNPAILQQISASLGLRFTPEKEATEGTFAPIDLLDYIYAVLHSPTYRDTYKEFLKIDFPRVPILNQKHFGNLSPSADACATCTCLKHH